MLSPRSTREKGTFFDASDRLDRRGGGDLREAFELEQLLLGQAVEVRAASGPAPLPEEAIGLLADALDVGRPFDPVDQRLEPSGRARAVGAAVHHLALGLDDLRAAERALLRHSELLRALAVRAGRPDDLRDDVACALDDDVVALADLLAVDVLLVVEGRARDRHASHLDRLDHRPRVQRAGSADPDEDLVQPRHARSAAPTCRRAPSAAAGGARRGAPAGQTSRP